MRSRRRPPRDLDVERRVAVEEIGVGQQAARDAVQTLAAGQVRPGDRQFVQPPLQPRQVFIALEQRATDGAPYLVDPVAEHEPAVIDRNRRRGAGEKVAVEVCEHVLVNRRVIGWKVTLGGGLRMSNIVLETDRLRLRELATSDLDFVAEMLGDADVMRYYPKRLDRTASLAWIERQQMRYARDGHGLWLVLERDTGQPIGQVGLVMQEVTGMPRPRYAEVGLPPASTVLASGLRHRGGRGDERLCLSRSRLTTR